jgi:CxxC motif-containing protein (DUF1111 family)
MSHLRLAVLVTFLFACTDRTEPPGPPASENPDEVTLEEEATDLELEPALDLAESRGHARTALSGGATTVFDESEEAFESPAPNLQGENIERHELGDVAFELEHVDGTGINGGLGPIFDNVSCESCHPGDGRGRPPAGAEPFSSMLFRSSVSGAGNNGGPKDVPGFGGQLQMRSLPAYQPEISAVISYVESYGTFADRTPFQLRVPTYTLTGIYANLPAGVLFSPRVAPAVFGLGLLEAVPERQIVAQADPSDRNRDGISGRANYVWDAVAGRTALGRFGWKANAPNLIQQTAGAYNGDMGVTTELFPAEPCEGQHAGCARHPPDLESATVADVALYTRTLGVPARRNLDDRTARRGEKVFYAAGCAGCHTPTLRTGVLPDVPEVSNQEIHPYTDLLVHDMGPGLADSRPDFQASGSEWRTPPLWGIGLVATVNGHTNFLHDGRARTLLEAVMWHGGEATRARDRVQRLRADDRGALIAFLESL